MPNSTLQTLQNVGSGLGFFDRLQQGYLQGQEQSEAERQQDFIGAALSAGKPVETVPYQARGLIPSFLQALHVIPREIQATPSELGMEKAALEDRQIAGWEAIGKLAQQLSPQGLSALLKQNPDMAAMLGMTPEIASQFITPVDIRQIEQENTLAERRNLDEWRKQQGGEMLELKRQGLDIQQGNQAIRQQVASEAAAREQDRRAQQAQAANEREYVAISGELNQRVLKLATSLSPDKTMLTTAQGIQEKFTSIMALYPDMQPRQALGMAVQQEKAELAASIGPAKADFSIKETLKYILGGVKSTVKSAAGTIGGGLSGPPPGGGGGTGPAPAPSPALPPLPWH